MFSLFLYGFGQAFQSFPLNLGEIFPGFFQLSISHVPLVPNQLPVSPPDEVEEHVGLFDIKLEPRHLIPFFLWLG